MLTLEQYEKLIPSCHVTHEGKTISYLTPSTFLKWRVDSLFTKEPCTLEWIAGFGAADVLVDVGANVGMYTVWAAKTRGVRVFAFEPESQNYGLLNRNLMLNGLGEQVKAYCLALSDSAGFSELHLASLDAGALLPPARREGRLQPPSGAAQVLAGLRLGPRSTTWCATASCRRRSTSRSTSTASSPR